MLLRPIGVIDKLFIPDDTYYTLTIARSIANGHGPTVDGHTLTSGFQALLGFLMVPVYWLTDNPDTALRIDLALLVVVDTADHRRARVGRVPLRRPRRRGDRGRAVGDLPGRGVDGARRAGDVARDPRRASRWWPRGSGPTTTVSTRRAVVTGVVAGLAVLARVDIALLVALLGGLQLWRGPRRLLVPGAIAGAVVVAPWWIWCTVQFGTPDPDERRRPRTELAPLQPLRPGGAWPRSPARWRAGRSTCGARCGSGSTTIPVVGHGSCSGSSCRAGRCSACGGRADG